MRAFYLLALASLVACGGNQSATDNPAEVVEDVVAGVQSDLSADDMPLIVSSPEGEAVAAVWREELGQMSVNAGDHFGLVITEEPGDLGRKKADLDRDLLQTHEILDETASSLVYKSSFPDSPNLVFHHLYEIVVVGDRTFVVSDNPDGKYSKGDIEKMRGAVKGKVEA